MARAMVASFGHDERFVLRALTRHRLGTGDTIILLTADIDERVERAYNSLRDILSRMGESPQLRLETLEKHMDSFPRLVGAIRRILENVLEAHENIILVLSGGMRVIVLALYTALLLLSRESRGKISVIELEPESPGKNFGAVFQIPGKLLDLFSGPELGIKTEILKTLADQPGITVQELSRILRRDESTVRKHVKSLAEMGLVRLEGVPQKLYLTEIAYALL